ncbi:MAG: sigma-54 dependent transcriptional regulator [Pseudoxanthomonas sp.]|nr:sigma-54 dependent transcriptional regulator [Pseudoxanthomonas sp.]
MSQARSTAPGQRTRILLVDDDRNVLRGFRMTLEDAGYRVATATDPAAAERKLAEGVFDLCFLDQNIGSESGLDLLPRLRQQAPWMRVVMVTGENSVPLVVKAMQLGASDYLIKPCPAELLLGTAARQAEASALARRVAALEQAGGGGTGEVEPASVAPAMQRVLDLARQVADTDASVLILGESGTGKGVLARAIHGWSRRSDEAFVTINCPGLSGELIASELFGHVRGAFTGASENKLGRVDQADGGTLFFDEIGDFPLALQPRLLRFIQDREFERVGDPVTRKADVRMLAATNRDLKAMVADGSFREDLLYRLNVITVELPPLREHAEDIEPLAGRFLARFAAEYRRPARGFSASATRALRAYPWPGNIRELQNVVERASILARGEEVEAGDLGLPESAEAAGSVQGRPRAGDAVSLEALEQAHIEAVLGASESLEAAARTLGIDSSTLYRKRKRWGL